MSVLSPIRLSEKNLLRHEVFVSFRCTHDQDNDLYLGLLLCNLIRGIVIAVLPRNCLQWSCYDGYLGHENIYLRTNTFYFFLISVKFVFGFLRKTYHVTRSLCLLGVHMTKTMTNISVYCFTNLYDKQFEYLFKNSLNTQI